MKLVTFGDEQRVGALDRDEIAVLDVPTMREWFERGGADDTAERTSLASARLRAVEHGRWTLVAALAGVSAVVDPSGAVTERIELFEQDIMMADVELSDARTVATVIGEWPEWLLTALAVAGVALTLVRTRLRPAQDRTREDAIRSRVGVDAR